MTTNPVLLVGCGPMAVEHARALTALGQPYVAVGRGEASARRFAETTGVEPRTGGLDAALPALDPLPERAVVAVPVAGLEAAVTALVEAGVPRVLLEKPGGTDREAVARVAGAATSAGATVLVAYNRRFYASVALAREMIAEDGGPLSFTFDFTEIGSRVEAAAAPPEVKANWLLANSSHVVDLAFHLGGDPVDLTARVSQALDWHPAGAVFTGSGTASTGALFSYHADWVGPGRWGVEVVTARRRLVLRPLEELAVVEHGFFEPAPVPVDDEADRAVKPGILRQMEAFLAGDDSLLPTVQWHLERIDAVIEPITRGAG